MTDMQWDTYSREELEHEIVKSLYNIDMVYEHVEELTRLLNFQDPAHSTELFTRIKPLRDMMLSYESVYGNGDPNDMLNWGYLPVVRNWFGIRHEMRLQPRVNTQTQLMQVALMRTPYAIEPSVVSGRRCLNTACEMTFGLIKTDKLWSLRNYCSHMCASAHDLQDLSKCEYCNGSLLEYLGNSFRDFL